MAGPQVLNQACGVELGTKFARDGLLGNLEGVSPDFLGQLIKLLVGDFKEARGKEDAALEVGRQTTCELVIPGVLELSPCVLKNGSDLNLKKHSLCLREFGQSLTRLPDVAD